MLVVVPYVPGKLHHVTRAAVRAFAPHHRFVPLDADDDGAYGRLVRELWSAGEPFAICEQDTAPTRRQLDDLAACPGGWCSFLYDDALYPDGPMLGLVRFSADVLREHPIAAECALVIGRRRDTEAPWWNVDNLIARDLQIRGVPWCCHRDRVRHLHHGEPSGPMVDARA